MGMYTEFEFKGIVKKEYRKKINFLMTEESVFDWLQLELPFARKFAVDYRSSMIPFSSELAERAWNFETGEWSFIASLKNYTRTIEKFLEIVPQLFESVAVCNTQYEDDEFYRHYVLKDNVMQEVVK